jgi:GNAT superfamily N-acetyltransferase
MRPATPRDAEFILANIKGLAEVEGRPEAVHSTPQTIREALFGERATASAVVFESASVPVGHAWFFERIPTFSGKRVLCLEDIFICPQHRGRGIGQRAMALLAAHAHDRDCTGMHWEVKAGNDAAERFYQRLGATPDPTIISYTIHGEPFSTLAHSD